MKSKNEKHAARLEKAQRQADGYDAQFEGPVVPLTPKAAKEAAYRPSLLAGLIGGIWWPMGWKQANREKRAAELRWGAMTPEQRRAHHHATMNFGQGGG
ncbi:hypothetical protein [Arthrobacter sp. SX1312]|uniref:hypothetical protein n=1 Tax=Arthrobacter sp. SX1312 TaxID=2058896 RepID=UPI0011AFD737|nr:hypothetical protein [Arthrobacter sp. SX1312]